MKKVLPLERWKKEEPPERECFSGEDSDEEDSEYEEIVIPKKKQAQRKFRANEAASSKRIKPNPKPQLRVPKKLVPRARPSAKKAASGINRTARSTSWCASVKAVETEALIHPFSKIIREGTNCILL